MNDSKNEFSLLFLSSDKYPPRRVDVKVLFGEILASRGHCIDFVLQSDEDCDANKIEYWSGCKVFVGKTNNGTRWYQRLLKHLYSISSDLRSFRLVNDKKYDFLQLKDKYLSAAFLIPLCRIKGIKFIYWLSFPFPEESLLKCRDSSANYPVFYWVRGKVFDFLFYRVISRYSDFIFVQSEQMKKDLIRRGVPEYKQLPVPMGVRSSEIVDSGQSRSGNEILYLGTLARVRKMDFLIRVFARVNSCLPETRLVLVGAGDDEQDMTILKEEARRLNLMDKVLFTGWLAKEDAMEYVRRARLCLSPFYPTPIFNSTSPTKLIEYMALGKAVVANDHPEQRLVLEESQAGICVPYTEEAFSEAIIELMKNPDRARKMGSNGLSYVKANRSYDKIADDVEGQYLKLLRRA